jgi:hypothetical protein
MAEAERATKEKEELEKTTSNQLWLKDLDEFEAAWEKMKKARLEDCMSAADRVKVKKPMKKKA